MIALVHSYCLYRDGTRMTAMTQESVIKAAELFRGGKVSTIVLAAAYEDAWEKEIELKMALLKLHGIKVSDVRMIPNIKDSFEEVDGIRKILDDAGENELVVVAEQYHAPRSADLFRGKLPGVIVHMEPFITPYYEPALEPHPSKLLGKVKSYRAGKKWAWIAWNKAFRVLGWLKMALDKRKSKE